MRFYNSYITSKFKQKNLQMLILIFAISISAALFIVANALTILIKSAYLEDLNKKYINADIYMKDSNNISFEESEFIKIKEIKTVVPVIELSSICIFDDESAYLDVVGINLNDIEKFNKYKFTAIQDNIKDENYIFITNKMADKYGLKIEDMITIPLNNNVYSFKIKGLFDIAGNTNTIDDSYLTNAVIIPNDILSKNVNITKYNVIYLFMNDETSIDNVSKKLSNTYPDVLVQKIMSDEMINQDVKGIFTTLNFLAIIVFFTCFYIIITSYRVIVKKRLWEMGIIRSLGSTIKTTKRLLIYEAMLLGGIGGIAGCILGYLVLFILSKTIIFNGLAIKFSLNFEYIVGTIIGSALISMISIWISCKKMVNIDLRQLISDKQEEKLNIKYTKAYWGVTLIVLAIILPYITAKMGKEIAASANMLAVLFALFGVIMSIPIVIRIFAFIFNRIINYKAGFLHFAFNNLKQNKNAINSISVLAISITCSLLITIVGTGILSSTSDFFQNDVKFDIWLGLNNADQKMINEMKDLKNVKDIYGSHESLNVKVQCNGKTHTIERIQGVKDNNIINFLDFDIDDTNILNDMNSGRFIILSNMLKDQFNAEVGDEVVLEFQSNEYKYKVKGFYNTVFDGGNTALVSDLYLVEDAKLSNYRMLYLKLNQTDYLNDTINLLKNNYQDNRPSININSDLSEEHLKSQEQMISIQNIFGIFCLLICLIGMMNNFLLNYDNRSNYFAIYRSLGMSSKNIISMLISENIIIGIFGGMLGCVMTKIILFIIPYLFKAVAAPKIYLEFNVYIILAVCCLSVLLTVIASIIPLLKVKSRNILIDLKRE